MLRHFLVALMLFGGICLLWLLLLIATSRRGSRPDAKGAPDPQVSVTLRTANAATELVPRYDSLIAPDDAVTITITGAGGDYAGVAARQAASEGAEPPDPNNGLWTSSLRRWLNRGARINYLLAAPTAEGVALLGQLEEQYPRSFRLFLLSESCFDDPEDQTNVRDLISFHPCLLDNATTGSRALWIENRHPPGSAVARDVEYVAPRDVKNDLRFDKLDALLNRYMTKSLHRSHPVQPAMASAVA